MKGACNSVSDIFTPYVVFEMLAPSMGLASKAKQHPIREKQNVPG